MALHYTQWDRSDRAHPQLMVGGTTTVLARFDDAAGTATEATAASSPQWSLEKTAEGLRASVGQRTFSLQGRVGRDKTLTGDWDGQPLSFVNETSAHWVILDAHDEKIAQFSGGNNGVRAAIVEFTPDSGELSNADIIALSWAARMLLEARLERTSVALIATLVLASITAIVAFIV